MSQLSFTEVDPASAWCQRWAGGQHSWRHRSDGSRFEPGRHDVEPIDEAAAKAFVVGHHYSGSYPNALLRYGLHRDGALAGVAVLSLPMHRKVLTNVFPSLDGPDLFGEAMELGRFVLVDECEANAESWFLARVFELAARDGVRGVVSFADPVPRRDAGGGLVMPGHVGTIYQATNARYCGRSTPCTHALLPDGTVLSPRAMQKVRTGERGHDYVERDLVRRGARPRRVGQPGAVWLAEALDDVGARRFRHRGKHRYVFTLGTRSQRRRLHVAVPDTRPYPKRPDLEAA